MSIGCPCHHATRRFTNDGVTSAKSACPGLRTSSLSLACTSWDLSAARVRLAPVIRRRHMAYDVRYFILHSLGAGPKPQVRPYRFCTEYKGIETNALPPCATVITYHQPVVLRTVRVCRVVFRRRFFSPYTPDSSVTHGGALRKDLSHLPLR